MRSASIDIIRATQRDRDGGDKKLQKNRESHSEVCTCGMSPQQWPNIRITLLERTRQSATRRWDDTSRQEANEFLCLKTPPFLKSSATKNSAKYPGNAFSDALLKSLFQNFAAGVSHEPRETRETRFQSFNSSINSGSSILRSYLLLACIRDVGCAHSGFAPYLERIRCPKSRMHTSQWPFWLCTSVPKTTLACIRFRSDPCVHCF